jgi:cytokinin riboside 5'-monophosphate phosphoribohydrolase
VIEHICVYASSSERIDPKYRLTATALGEALAKSGRTLVYGGAKIGLMGAVALAAKSVGGRVVGVIPQHIADHNLAFEDADEMIVTNTMRERKLEMESRSDGFIALPGGFGTLEELLEMITLKQLHRHAKAICLLDADGFYRPLIDMFEHLYAEGFANAAYRELYFIGNSVDKLIAYLDAYVPPTLGDKWR